jgi:dihydropteroate synthase
MLPRFRSLPRPLVMGVLNVTPDSFSDGGKYFRAEDAIERARQMVADGADLIDLGGESTRPGSDPVTADEELRRVLPVLEAIAGKIGVPISIDTYKSDVAGAALAAGAEIVNDISGGRMDPEMLALVAEKDVPIILGHIRGTPRYMQERPQYRDVVAEVADELEESAVKAIELGLSPDHVLVDPGIGFGKLLEHNLALLKHLGEIVERGRPVVVGVSRKKFIGTLLDNAAPDDRIEGTAAATALCVSAGAAVIRVHDVKQMARVVKVAAAIVRSP